MKEGVKMKRVIITLIFSLFLMATFVTQLGTENI